MPPALRLVSIEVPPRALQPRRGAVSLGGVYGVALAAAVGTFFLYKALQKNNDQPQNTGSSLSSETSLMALGTIASLFGPAAALLFSAGSAVADYSDNQHLDRSAFDYALTALV